MKENNNTVKAEIEKVNKEILKQKQRIANARTLMLDGEIDSNEFKNMRIEIEEKITKLIVELSTISSGLQNIDSKISTIVELLPMLGKHYEYCDVTNKRHIVSSIFPSGMIFDEKKSRTLELNKAMAHILSIDKGSEESKKRKHSSFGVLSHRVDPERFELSSKQGINMLSTKFRT